MGVGSKINVLSAPENYIHLLFYIFLRGGYHSGRGSVFSLALLTILNNTCSPYPPEMFLDRYYNIVNYVRHCLAPFLVCFSISHTSFHPASRRCSSIPSLYRRGCPQSDFTLFPFFLLFCFFSLSS